MCLLIKFASGLFDLNQMLKKINWINNNKL